MSEAPKKKVLSLEEQQLLIEQLMRDNQDLKESLQKQNDSLATRLAKLDPNNTTVKRMVSKAFRKTPIPVLLTNEPKESASHGMIMEMKHDACPFCNEKGKKNIVDLDGSRWQCRVCGKHWIEDALFKKYTKQLEKFDISEVAGQAV